MSTPKFNLTNVVTLNIEYIFTIKKKHIYGDIKDDIIYGALKDFKVKDDFSYKLKMKTSYFQNSF